jgi:excisionase family DNA binding protein
MSKRQLVTEVLGHGLLSPAPRYEHGHAAISSDIAVGEILTLEEAAELLRVEADDLRSLAESGQLPARRIGNAWRLSRSAVLAWLGVDDAAPVRALPPNARRSGPLGFVGGVATTNEQEEAGR